MSDSQPQARHPVTHARLLLFVSAACFLLAALAAAFGWPVGPVWAWAFGGASAFVLSAVV